MNCFIYLATPYSRYSLGIDAAFRLACREAGRFIRAGIPIYSPIAHTHPIAIECGIDPLDHGIWLPADTPMMKGAISLIVCEADGWQKSLGIDTEIRAFESAKKPVLYYNPIDPVEFDGVVAFALSIVRDAGA